MANSETTILRLVDQLSRALRTNDRGRLKHIIAQLIALNAPLGGQWGELAKIAAEIGELTLFRAAADLLVEGKGGGPAAQYQKVVLLAEQNDWSAAYDLLRQLPEDVPDPVSNAYSRGTSLLYLGRPAEAREYLDEVVRFRPRMGYPWFVLSMTVDFAQEPDLAERIIAAEPGLADAGAAQRAPYYYALGKVHAERGDHAAAFAAFARGAREARTLVRFSRAADDAEAEEAVKGYSAERIAGLARRQRKETGRTIFVTGLPRSGTTLLEQILTSHSAVRHGEESGRLFLLSREIGGTSFPALTRYIDAQGFAPATDLWRHWLDDLAGAEGRVVDKTIATSRVLGLAAALLPDAPLIWVKRDPLDCAWSCFRTNFLGGAMPWSYDLEDIAFHFRLEDRLLEQWQQILGERLLVVPYEALVSEPGEWIRRVLVHCGLQEEPQVFAPHETARAVATASMMQVRQPINTRAVGSAKPYREFLKPFLMAYRE